MLLDEIVATKAEEASALRRWEDHLEDRAESASAPRDLEASLRMGADADAVAVIAEFKRRSPSAEDLAPEADPGVVARSYEEGGAAAISVLTDGPHFGGSLSDIEKVRAACSLPVLRKDFLLDPVQVLEARAAGADAVLLITRILDDARLRDLLSTVQAHGMTPLVEVHDDEELQRALRADARVIGVNARDLATLEVDIGGARELLSRVPPDRIAVAESGVTGAEDVADLGAAGADAVLVGTWLMRSGASRVSELTGQPRSPRGRARGSGLAAEPSGG
ncbi:MAG: indole-3-glycerol phosphate synthase TrpC [Candidatus Palauibacterales bacterium]|nr:indole-3-glycerol phosphate synthase TrpC [Candidatus Palauibacterales bacterium]MDP2529487.1 indole-3-glycerol phosphate synthase TrpC [Candidatus Palauibacterales bacterium]MDP2585165.1 indole-3-glycerol phosphate synthase TrpC [Candidatus Palauibacterales bacterium]